MGGLISLYGFLRTPDMFGFAGVMSPSLWFARGAIFADVNAYVGGTAACISTREPLEGRGQVRQTREMVAAAAAQGAVTRGCSFATSRIAAAGTTKRPGRGRFERAMRWLLPKTDRERIGSRNLQ